MSIENVEGSDYDDTLIGSTGNNTLHGRGGNDILDGGTGADIMAGGTGDDIYFVDDAGDVTTELVLEGIDRINTVLAIFTLVTGVENLAFIGSGNAVLTGNANGNLIIGGAGDDIITGIVGSDNLNGGGGNDRFILFSGELASIVDGGSGIDTLVVAPNPGFAGGTLQFTTVSAIEALELSGGVNVIFSGSQFANGLASNSALSGTGTITVNMDAGVNFSAAGMSFTSTVATVVNGSSANDVIKLGLGESTGNTVNSGDGVDQIRGSNGVDTINGGIGNDKIMGIGGADVLTGGAGNDQFRYFQQSDSGLGAAADRITDFTIGGDKMNFLLIDADAAVAGDQAFNFVGTAAFANTGIGQIRYQDSGADLLVQADVNGDGVADMEIILQGRAGGTLTAADFIL